MKTWADISNEQKADAALYAEGVERKDIVAEMDRLDSEWAALKAQYTGDPVRVQMEANREMRAALLHRLNAGK